MIDCCFVCDWFGAAVRAHRAEAVWRWRAHVLACPNCDMALVSNRDSAGSPDHCPEANQLYEDVMKLGGAMTFEELREDLSG